MVCSGDVMPHVVLNGNVDVESVFGKLEPIFIREGSRILRTLDMYLDRNKTSVLIDSLVVDSGLKTSFLALISGREDGLVVRLYPKVDVEKTDGVKQILAEIAKQLMRVIPGLKVGETNLDDYLR